MGFYADIEDHDVTYAGLDVPPIIANTLEMSTKEDKEQFNRLVMMVYDDDTLSAVPSCDCGRLRGAYITKVCVNCGTPVRPATERPIESMVWIEAPEEVAGFINPIVYQVLSKAYTFNDVNLIKWLINPFYRPAEKGIKYVQILKGKKLPRGINAFITHFDAILMVLQDIKPSSKDQLEHEIKQRTIRKFVDMHRHKFFPKYLPIPARIAFITERTYKGTFADANMLPCIDAMRTMASMARSNEDRTVRFVENRVARAVDSLGEYYNNMYRNIFSKKEGYFRKHIFGNMQNYTARAVITSLSDWHVYDEVEMPWSLMVSGYKQHIRSKLLKRTNPKTGRIYTPREMDVLFRKYTNTYSPLFDEIFDELIAESPYRATQFHSVYNPILTGEHKPGLPCIVHRN